VSRGALAAAPSLSAALSLGFALIAVCAPRATRAQEPSEHVSYQEIRLPAPWGEARVLLTHARGRLARSSTTRQPIVVALHGAGEARRGPDRGFLGWVSDYELPRAFGALGRGHLRAADYGDMVRAEHLALRNRELHGQPFRDLLVVTPFTPDLMAEVPGSDAIRAYGDWIAGPLLAAVRREVPSAALTAAGTGIDGVSLGGMLALETGLRHPDAFGAVGGIQPAIRGRVEALAPVATGTQRMRLLSSDDDPFLAPTRALDAALTARHVDHELVVTPGHHGYAFNRGPGGIELLFFHDRALAHEPL
jgi:hypothetical protein